MSRDRSVVGDLCTLYFDYSFETFHRICELLQYRNVVFTSTIRDGLPYVPQFKYYTLSILNEPTSSSHVAEVFYQLNVPASQLRTECVDVQEDIVSYYDKKFTEWFREKVGEKHIVDQIAQFVGSTRWWEPVTVYSRISVRALLTTLSLNGYLLYGHEIAGNYLLDHQSVDYCNDRMWAFTTKSTCNWSRIITKFLNRCNFGNILNTEELKFAECAFDALEIYDIRLCFRRYELVPIVDIDGILLDKKGNSSTMTESVDFYLQKIKNRELTLVSATIGQEEIDRINEYKEDGWVISNVCYNKRKREYCFRSCIEKLQSKLTKLKSQVEEVESELGDIDV